MSTSIWSSCPLCAELIIFMGWMDLEKKEKKWPIPNGVIFLKILVCAVIIVLYECIVHIYIKGNLDSPCLPPKSDVFPSKPAWNYFQKGVIDACIMHTLLYFQNVESFFFVCLFVFFLSQTTVPPNFYLVHKFKMVAESRLSFYYLNDYGTLCETISDFYMVIPVNTFLITT